MHANADGHELAMFDLFEAKDRVHTAGVFTSFCFKATAQVCGALQPIGTLQRYGYTFDQLPQHGGTGAVANQPPITVVTGFRGSE